MLNFKIQENKPVTTIDSENYDKPNWVTIAYCSSIKSCLKYLVDREVLKTELKDLETVITAIDNLKSDIDKLNI